ncbi:helix-turn-helix transcriptional regulator [Nonomuraea sp. NPDC049684]|uniref:helix-turn-helix transcriptional regulator n=1 Tax=unclassified Nonomuraea TaxID=2593643 RepID=UPI00378ED2B2
MSMAHEQPDPGGACHDGDSCGPAVTTWEDDAGGRDDEPAAEELASPIDSEFVADAERQLAEDVEPESDEARQARLENDHKIVMLLRADLAAGRRDRFDRVAEQLVRYALPILGMWVARGEIFAKVNQRREQANQTRAGQGKSPLPKITRDPFDWRAWDRDEVEEFVHDLAGEGVERFRRAVEEGQCDPRRGASMRTYFIGGCLFAFEKVYRHRCRQQRLERALVSAGLAHDVAALEPVRQFALTPGPERQVIVRDEISRAMAQIPAPEMHQVLWYSALGYTQQEAAEKAGLTPKALEGRLRRVRQKFDRRNTAAQTTTDPDDAER